MQQTLIDLAFTALKAAIGCLVPFLLLQAIGAIRDNRARQFAATVVRAAQQMIPATSDRYDWAAGELSRRFPMLRQQEVRALIEAAVHAIKNAPTLVTLPVPPVQQDMGDDEPTQSDRA